MFAPQTNPASPAVLTNSLKTYSVYVYRGCFPLPLKLFPVYQFFLAVAILLANFGVRLYVSIVAGGSTTTSILAKAVERRTGFLPIFLMICQFVFPDRVICVFCKKILCLRAKDFFAIASSEGRRKIAPQINSGDGGKETKFSNCQQSQNNFRWISLDLSRGFRGIVRQSCYRSLPT